MAVVETRGTAVCVLVLNTENAFTNIRDATGTIESFTLWAPGQPVIDFSPGVLQSMWLSLLREAIVSGTPVTVRHEEDSSGVQALQLG